MSTLADRIRGLNAGRTSAAVPSSDGSALRRFDTLRVVPSQVEGRQAQGVVSLPNHAGLEACATDSLASVLGGEWRQYNGASSFIVETRRDPSSVYGRDTVGALADRLEQAGGEAPLLAGGLPARFPFVFFDLETTGLSGGAGTYAFLVGCGWFSADGAFVTRQHMLVRFADERALLSSVAGELARAGALVSFNGKSFDGPVLETRYLYHRLEWIGRGLPHVDMLHHARQFWRPRAGGAQQDVERCSLIALEQQQLGVRRRRDVPGFEIPSRYFQFVRSGDARPLGAVFEHNRLDLLSLAALTARVLHLVRMGPDHAHDAREALALGRLYSRARLAERARVAYLRAASGDSGSMPATQIDALRALAHASRRVGGYDEAAGFWRQLLDVQGCPPHVVHEASEALAIHHEHRARDLKTAKAFALRGLANGHPAWSEAAQHRLARIEKKIGKSHTSRLTFAET